MYRPDGPITGPATEVSKPTSASVPSVTSSSDNTPDSADPDAENGDDENGDNENGDEGNGASRMTSVGILGTILGAAVVTVMAL